MSGNVKYIAVARATDNAIVASYVQRGDSDEKGYVKALNDVLAAPDFSFKVTPNSRYRLTGDMNAFNFVVDKEKRVYVVITGTSYPERVAFLLLQDIMKRFKSDCGERSLSCGAGALNRKCNATFAKFATEYNDPKSKDKVLAVQSQVDDVKLTMHKNIDGMLSNLEKTSKIEEDTKRLQDQARLFDKQATKLKRRECWKSWKLTLIVGLLICLLIGLIIWVAT